MREYHKIQGLFKRHMIGEKRGKFMEGEWSMAEFEYLKNNIWVWTEKIDGTNIRIDWDGEKIAVGGRTANAQIPVFLLRKLETLFMPQEMKELYPETSMTLYGEGYGAKIQKGGGNYISDGVDFILFDVMIGDWWLKRNDVEDIAKQLGIKIVPIVGWGTIDDAVQRIKQGIKSTFGNFMAEGIVLRPQVELKDRAGRRIIAKIKHKDF